MGVTHTFNCGIADDPGAAAAGQILPSHWNDTHTVNVDLSAEVTGTLPVANGGTGTTTPSLVAGTNVTITGTWPNQTINASGGGGGVTINTTTITGGTSGRILYDNAGTVGEKAVTGTGDVVLATSPTLTTPNLGTPSALTLTNATGLPVGGISATGTPSASTYLRGDGSWQSVSASPGGSNTYVQYNDGGAFGGESTFTYDKAVNRLYVDNATIGSVSSPAYNVDATGYFFWDNRAGFRSPADGDIVLSDNAETDFGQLQFGGTTSSYPSLKRSGTDIQFRLADDSAYSAAAASALKIPGSTSGTVTLTAAATAGTWTLTLPTSAGTNGYVLQTDGSGNTSWVAQSGGGGGITIGTTTITSGTSGRILYDNAGVVGEKAVTGTGDVVLATSPTLVTPLLGTPTSGTLTNCTGLPVGGISATGTPSSTTYLRGDGSWQTISSGGGTKTLARFTPLDNQPPASNFATLDTRNSVALLDFDAATDESAVFVGVINQGATLTSGILVTISWAATSATSGACVWGAQFEKTTGQDIDSDSFDTATTATTTTSGTSGVVNTTSITCTSIDSLAAGDCFRVKIYRNAAAAGDTMTGDAELVAVELQQVA